MMDDGRSAALSIWAWVNVAGLAILTFMGLANPHAPRGIILVGAAGAILWLLTYTRQSLAPIGLSLLYVGSGWYHVANAGNPASQFGVIIGSGGALIILWYLWLRDEKMREQAEAKRRRKKAKAKRQKSQAKRAKVQAEAK